MWLHLYNIQQTFSRSNKIDTGENRWPIFLIFNEISHNVILHQLLQYAYFKWSNKPS